MSKQKKDLTLRPDAIRSREITLTVPVGLRYQTTKLFTDGGYTEVRAERGPINPEKAISQDLGRTMPDYDCEPWIAFNAGDTPTVEGYTLAFSKMVKA